LSGRDRPPRVLFVCGSDFTSPSEKQVLWFTRELTARGSEVMISLMGDPESARVEGADRVDGLRLLWPKFTATRPSRSDLEQVREFKPDLVHAFNARVPVVAAARAYSKAAGVPVLMHWEDDEWGLQHGFPTDSLARRLVWAGRRAASRAHPPLWYLATPRSLRWAGRNAVAHDALTPRLAAYVTEKLRRPCTVIFPASAHASDYDGAEPPSLPARVQAGRIATYTGEIHPARIEDIRLVIRAIAIAQQRGLDATFVHAGGNVAGVDTSMLAEEAGLRTGSYSFLGHVPFARIPPLLRESAALIAASRPIPFNTMCLPSKLQAYLASGTPVIASAPGAGELLEDREEVLKTNTGRPEELADRLSEVLTDDSLAAKLAAGGPRAAKRLFDPARNTDALIEHYRQSLSSDRMS
jgi:glycosyltransferase involved in cell wall biosynthesis